MSTSEPPAQGSSNTDQPHILVVEDHAGLRWAITLTLAEAGYTVEEAADGYTALARLRASPRPLVALLDYHLPGLTGGQVLDALAADGLRNRHACLLMSVTLSSTLQMLAQRHGVPLLMKPIPLEELLRAVAASRRRLGAA